MRRLIKNFVLFFAAFVLFGGAAVLSSWKFDGLEHWLWGNSSSNGSTNLRIPEFVEWSSTHPGPDILFLGSSTCYRGINPERLDAFGLATYNLCSSAQPLATSQFLLDFSLDYSLPKTIVLDMYEGVLGCTCYQSRRDHIVSNNLVGAEAFQRMARNTGDPFFIMQAQYFGWKRGAVPLSPMQPPGSEVYVGRGFVSSAVETKDILPCDHEAVEMHPDNIEALQYIAERCDQLGIDLVLLSPPMTCSGDLNWPECTMEFDWVDGNDWPEAKNDTMYYDDHHLRAVGANSYSDWLGNELLNL